MTSTNNLEIIYEIINGDTQKRQRLKLDTKKDFEEGVRLFMSKSYEYARKRFIQVLEKDKYDGAAREYVILATNLVEQIDDAFRRRIKFMVPFRFPDVSTRTKLWHSLIPEKTPLDDSIDLDFFANQFELSGSQIKEILWNAAYIAVSDNQPLGNEQIKQSIIWNYIKYGKQLIKEDFGYLA